MLFLTNSDFAADISDVARQFFPNDKTEKTESNTDFRLGFFVEHEKGFDKFPLKKLSNLYFVTMTEYSNDLNNVFVAFPPEEIKNSIKY